MNYYEAEKWLIGSLLVDPTNFEKIEAKISKNDFFNPILGKIFLFIEEFLMDENFPPDRMVLYSFLKERLTRDEFKEVVGLADEIPTDALIEVSIKAVKRGSIERRVRKLTEQEEIDFSALTDLISEWNFLEDETPPYRPLSEVSVEELESDCGISPGFIDLDRHVKFRPGNLIIIAGKTGEGKTSLGLQFIHHATKEGKTAGIVTLEMTGPEVKMRLINSFLNDLCEEKIIISDPPSLTTLDLKNIVQRMRKEKGIDILLIDYLQLMREREDYRSRHLEVSHIIRKIKGIGKEIGIPIIVISQLSRSIDSRGKGSLPSLGDLKESGDIEYASEIVFFLHTPEKEDEDYRGENVKLLIVGKNRWGKKGKIRLFWDEKRTRFANFKEGNLDERFF